MQSPLILKQQRLSGDSQRAPYFITLPKKAEVPFETCAKFGVRLFVTPMKDQPFKVVKRI